MALFSNKTLPFVGESKPPTIFNNVVFPEPLGPTILMNSPFFTFREISETANVS